jgi:hypothetical protein
VKSGASNGVPKCRVFSITFALAVHLYFASIFKEQGVIPDPKVGHMSFLTGQYWTLKFAGQVLLDWTKS